MTKIFLEDKKHTCELPLAMREELTNKGIIPKEIARTRLNIGIVVKE